MFLHLKQLQSFGANRKLLPFDDVVHVRLHLRHRLQQRQVSTGQGEVLLEVLVDDQQSGVGEAVGDKELTKVFGAVGLCASLACSWMHMSGSETHHA